MNEVYIVIEYGDAHWTIVSAYRHEDDAKLEVERLKTEDTEKERLYNEWVNDYNLSKIIGDEEFMGDCDFGYVFNYKRMEVL